ncbi:coronin-7-like [Portunus trituberculatus]|uniref:coronin-7-like n=1 Tax=Portunus trituberculatus TaxID=210409 RepID=UPI001E1CB63C|nr:coronin-7-like [Portunus trituberculatus]
MTLIKTILQSYREYHSDLYPETAGPHAPYTTDQWLNGCTTPVPKVSLDPTKRPMPVWKCCPAYKGLMWVSTAFNSFRGDRRGRRK